MTFRLPISAKVPAVKAPSVKAPSAEPAPSDALAPAPWRRHALAGWALIFSTFGAMGAWAAVARLDRAVISPGTITVENSRKLVQHLEGGIVRELLVKEGETVAQGQRLLRLDPVQSRANADLYRGQLDASRVQEARLLAERDGAPAPVLPPEIAGRAAEPDLARTIADQASQFRERQGTLKGQTGILETRVDQYRNELKGIAVERASVEAQVRLIDEELVGLRSLRAQNLIPVTRVLTMERERTRLEGVVGRSMADTAKAENGIGEAGLQIAQLRQKMQEEVAGQLLETRQRIVELREKLAVAEDVLRRLEVVAPRAGMIQNLKVSTVGQVVRAGEALMEIVPTDDRLVVHVQFSPNDLEAIHAGMPAEIKFPTFRSRRLPAILGTVESVSRDRLMDEATKQPYFLGIVQIDTLALPQAMRGRLVAGMPAEVVVTTGERTALDYMVGPFVEAMGRSFNEH